MKRLARGTMRAPRNEKEMMLPGLGVSLAVVKGNDGVMYYADIGFVDFLSPINGKRRDITIDDYLDMQRRTLVAAACNQAILVSPAEPDDSASYYYVRGQIWRVSERESDQLDDDGTPVRALLEAMAQQMEQRDGVMASAVWEVLVNNYLSSPVAQLGMPFEVQEELEWA